MKKTLIAMALALGFVGAASAQVSAASGAITGRIETSTSTYAAVNGNGGSVSHAQTDAGAAANGLVSSNPGAIAIAGGTSGYVNSSAYNIQAGNGVGSASAGGWSDAAFVGAAMLVVPGGLVAGAVGVDSGFSNAVRNGADASVVATTAQDGFVQSSYSGAATLNGTAAGVLIPGGASGNASVTSTQVADGKVNAGGITFTDGTPAGQTAAVRFGNTGTTVNATGGFVLGN